MLVIACCRITLSKQLDFTNIELSKNRSVSRGSCRKKLERNLQK
jgi:hypothetical protein